MKKRVVVYLIALMALLFLAGLPGGSTRAQADPSREAAIREDVEAVRLENGATADHLHIERNDDGTIRSIHGGSWGSGQSLPVDMALDFVKKHYIALGLTAPNIELLRVERDQQANGMRVLTFRQYFQGLPVLNSYLDVVLSASGQIMGVNNRLTASLALNSSGLSTIRFSKPADAAWKAASAKVTDIGGRPLLDTSDKSLSANLVSSASGYWATSSGLRSAHSLLVDYEFQDILIRRIVDDATGVLLQSNVLTQFLDGSGIVFNPNPINFSPLLPEGTLTISSPDSAFVSRVSTVPLREITTNDEGHYVLNGPYSHIAKPEGGYDVPAPATPGGFRYPRTSARFAAVNAYYWIDSSARAVASLGFPGVIAYSARTSVHDPKVNDNAGYRPSGDGTGRYRFGDSTQVAGLISYAEDADVVIHETGHGIQDYQTKGRYVHFSEAGAQGEGFSDFWACSRTYATSVANRFDPAVVGEWLAVNGIPGRRVDSSKHYPEDSQYELHADGEMWSSALWHVYVRLPDSQKDDLVKIVLQSHYLVADDPTFKDGGHALIEANASLLPSVVDARDLIRQSLKERGFFTHSAPESFSVAVTDKGNVIEWKNASDVAGSIQIMRGKDNDVPTPYQTFGPSETTYTDASVDPKGVYTYYLRAIDIDDPTNVAKTEPITVTASENVPSQLPSWYQPKTEKAQQAAGKGGCFIATAAYGTPTEAHVVSLRGFRDHVLMPTAAGRWFVATYYRWSPPVADWIRERAWARAMVRLGLAPVILTVENPVMALWVLVLTLAVCVRLAALRRRRAAVA